MDRQSRDQWARAGFLWRETPPGQPIRGGPRYTTEATHPVKIDAGQHPGAVTVQHGESQPERGIRLHRLRHVLQQAQRQVAGKQRLVTTGRPPGVAGRAALPGQRHASGVQQPFDRRECLVEVGRRQSCVVTGRTGTRAVGASVANTGVRAGSPQTTTSATMRRRRRADTRATRAGMRHPSAAQRPLGPLATPNGSELWCCRSSTCRATPSRTTSATA